MDSGNEFKFMPFFQALQSEAAAKDAVERLRISLIKSYSCRSMTPFLTIDYALRRHRVELVGLVDERTRELTSANANLLREITERERIEADLLKSQKLESLGILAGVRRSRPKTWPSNC